MGWWLSGVLGYGYLLSVPATSVDVDTPCSSSAHGHRELYRPIHLLRAGQG